MIIGGLGNRGGKYKTIPEVPRSAFNNHSDMLIINTAKKEMIVIEYKLSGWRKLAHQIEFGNPEIHSIGILNGSVPDPNLKENFKYRLWNIFSYTGQDNELERIMRRIENIRWTTIYGSALANIYYWGFLNTPSSLAGGIQTGKRISLFELYKDAILNLQKQYSWGLDFYLIYRILGYYSINQAKRYFKEVLTNRNQFN